MAARSLVAVGTAARLHLIKDDTLDICMTVNLESEVKDVLVLSKDFLVANVKGSRLVRLDMNSKSQSWIATKSYQSLVGLGGDRVLASGGSGHLDVLDAKKMELAKSHKTIGTYTNCLCKHGEFDFERFPYVFVSSGGTTIHFVNLHTNAIVTEIDFGRLQISSFVEFRGFEYDKATGQFLVGRYDGKMQAFSNFAPLAAF